ncbi:MAG: phenylalanine 4-monooxygenase [Proteobacteria bacterium]|nr:phenylalanine 4-monooxygenase [Pseudomonadota bacterium]
MEFKSAYESKKPDAQGIVHYTNDENQVWHTLYTRQMKLVPGRACDEFLKGLEILGLSADRIPQVKEINERMGAVTGWGVDPVAALISPDEFFGLLANRKFPAATFIRRVEELNYVKEPDIFHEIYGHCPLLTEPIYADFVRRYGQKVLTMDKNDWPLMQRLFWFTVEFGLIQTPAGLRTYGGGILSSIEETVYCVESPKPQRKPFDPVEVFRTPYRIDCLQPIYFVIESYQQLYDFIESDIPALLKKARELGEYPPAFEVDGSANEHINYCC